MMPAVPDGCTLRSVVNAMLYLRGNFCSSLATRSNISEAQAVASQLLEWRRTALWAAMKFTSLPLIVSTLTEDRERTLLSNLNVREPFAAVMDEVQAMTPRATTKFRVCRSCVEADRFQYGVAFTRVLHQIPGIRTCSTHDQLLENACGDCGKEYDLGSSQRRILPGRCRGCHSEKGRTMGHDRSAGYAAFSDIVMRGLLGRAPEVRPDRLLIALERFARLSVALGPDLLKMFTSFWGVDSLDKACACIGAKPEEIWRSLVFGIQPVSVFGAYGLASFFESGVKNAPDLPTEDVINASIRAFVLAQRRGRFGR